MRVRELQSLDDPTQRYTLIYPIEVSPNSPETVWIWDCGLKRDVPCQIVWEEEFAPKTCDAPVVPYVEDWDPDFDPRSTLIRDL